MATTFFIRTASESGRTAIIARVQRPEIKLDLRLSTGLTIDIEKWRKAQKSKTAEKNLRIAEKVTFAKLDEIQRRLDIASEKGLSSDDARQIIREIVMREAIEAQAAADAQRANAAERNNFIEYYEAFVEKAKAGKAKSIGKGKGQTISKRTAINYAQGLTWIKEYQTARLEGRGISFRDIDQAFFDDYQSWMEERELQAGQYKGEKGCKHNTISMRLAELKSVLKRAARDGQPVREDFTSIEIADDVDIDSIALTRPELDAILAVDLSDLPVCYEQARDLFMIGVWTAQRVSDYNNIKPEDIKTEKVWAVVEENGKKVARESEVTYISIRQKKTGAVVSIPVSTPLRAILEKYDCKLPFLWPQKINDYIKVVCERAGITQKELIVTNRGGKEIREYIERYKLVHTHTARKTGATQMYNAGVDLYDIMKVTGHTNLDTLKKYIKATGGEVALRIAAKYEYFR